MWCHLLFLVPIVIAGLFVFLPWTTALPVALLLAAGTALVVYAGWRAMRRPVVTGLEAMVGVHAEVVTDLNPEGLIRLRGELWAAKAPQPVSRGQREVTDVKGAKLIVRPWS